MIAQYIANLWSSPKKKKSEAMVSISVSQTFLNFINKIPAAEKCPQLVLGDKHYQVK